MLMDISLFEFSILGDPIIDLGFKHVSSSFGFNIISCLFSDFYAKNEKPALHVCKKNGFQHEMTDLTLFFNVFSTFY